MIMQRNSRGGLLDAPLESKQDRRIIISVSSAFAGQATPRAFYELVVTAG